MSFELADLLFPDVNLTPEALEQKYPPRALVEGAKVTRMAPSPTGFMHLGNLYGAIADERLAHQSGGAFFLRIEDTDKKREVEGGVETILNVFAQYGLPFDEGVATGGESGEYGPYRQSHRVEIYHACVKWLVQQDKAYPCFLTEDELGSIRQEQMDKKLDIGCYGSFAKYRGSELADVRRRIAEGQPYVVRYRSEGKATGRIKVNDMIRGLLELPENIQDVVLLKADGVPTYHFAHVVDDHLMRTSLVVRGEEWLATLPIHLQLFGAMGWKPPKYLHTAHLMKNDGGGKRKLSKRKDPELSLDFYSGKGYPIAAVKEYLMCLLNSNFEEWRAANADKPLEDFPFSVKKMSISGALFDINKLDDISRTVISRLDAQQAYTQLLGWAGRHDQEFAALLARDEAYSVAALSIGRGGKKPRKDITVYSEAREYLSFFYEELFRPDYALPPSIDAAMAREILSSYRDVYDPDDDATAWFDRIKALAEEMGFAANMKDYKANPEAYKGSVADVSMVLRLAVTGRAQSPDLFEVCRVMGHTAVDTRLEQMGKAL